MKETVSRQKSYFWIVFSAIMKMKIIFGYYDRGSVSVGGQETTDRVVREDFTEEKTFDRNLNDDKDSVM